MVFNAITFGFAGFMAQKSTLTARRPVTPTEWNDGLLIAGLSLICSALGYYCYRRLIARSVTSTPLPFDLRVSGIPNMTKILIALLVAGYAIKGFLPSVFLQILQAFLLYANIALLIIAFRNEVSSGMRVLILFVLTPMNALIFSTFSGIAIYGLFTTLLPVVIVYYQRKEKIPWVFVVSLIAAFVVLQPIKGEYRQLTWANKTSSALGFIEFAYNNVVESNRVGTPLSEWFEDSFRRLNHLHVTAAVIADTPDVVPFQKGATYTPLISKFIPRFIWLDKPTDNLGNSWAHMYRYLHKFDHKTSFNLPFITEMYMNFGIPGIVVISLLLGMVMGWLSRRYWAAGSSILVTAFGILIGMPFLTPESNLSLLAGRAIVGAITVYASLYVLYLLFPGIFIKRTHIVSSQMGAHHRRHN